MRKIYFQLGAALAGALALAGCGGGGGGGGSSLPAADQILPAVSDGTTKLIGAGYLSTGTGTWRVNLDGQVQTGLFGSSASMAGAMNYDTVANKWTINVDGTNLVLAAQAPGYATTNCNGVFCVAYFGSTSSSSLAQYGIFGTVDYLVPSAVKHVYIYLHAGLKTAALPVSGTATYGGGGSVFLGSVVFTDTSLLEATDGIGGNTTINVDFGANSVNFASSGVGGLVGSSYSLTGTGVITGNTYAGKLTGGSYLDGAGATVTVNTVSSTLSGAFYGPMLNVPVQPEETAGVVYSKNSSGTIAAGFWAPLL